MTRTGERGAARRAASALQPVLEPPQQYMMPALSCPHDRRCWCSPPPLRVSTSPACSYYWILGRVDDVINVSGHRIGTAEVESALVGHHLCAEAAVVPIGELRGGGGNGRCVCVGGGGGGGLRALAGRQGSANCC